MMLPLPNTDTIVACCTPQGPGAIALIRISGERALDIAQSISSFSGDRQLKKFPSHTVQYGSVIDAQGAVIDTALFIIMHGPRTFTGYDTVEITCHNNNFIIQSIIQQAIQAGARLAQNGEFTRQAVSNGKMDLIQAESLHEYIVAGTQQSLKTSLAQTKGTLSDVLVRMEKMLINALALSEASFEFIDEDMQFGAQIADSIQQIMTAINQLKQSCSMQKQLREGVRIALIGSVNAGKSSLFNALLATSRAIVSPIAGTTRDVVEAIWYKNNTHYTLIDTAGLRTTHDVIEEQGIARSYQEAAKADILLLIIDQSRAITQQEKNIYQDLLALYKQKMIRVYTKADMPKIEDSMAFDSVSIEVSTITGHNIAYLEQIIINKVSEIFNMGQAHFILNQRQQHLIIGLEQELQHIQKFLSGDIQYELISHHITQAIATLAELTGKSISEAAMDAIFKEFCIGK
ncbi:MAG TPA: tRNA uridine-5-carboxymethylaminomethyl(34) synthesis GTPase MnmE [Candidatus Babeliales bacterium]|jgi:tRNA modification GTPase|nr:tRNA uridine-5-carboxymethylaminomethyl(34) synthesis GTPase MnmE [Candidatus Babeliales bacterium]